MAPKILLATTCRWFSTARLAMAFARSGCAVEAICPSNHPIAATRVVTTQFGFNALTPLRSFRAAILAAKADLIVPCDDLAASYLHQLYRLADRFQDETSRSICRMISISLGDPAGYPLTESRDIFMAMIRREEIRAPETATIASEEELKDWLSRFGFPAVLKADGTSGGEGVKIVHTLHESLRAYRFLHAPLPTLVAAKRVILDKDWNCFSPWLAQRKRDISIQTFVSGPDTNMALACWQGKILSSISVEVLQTCKPKGPATIVRLIKNDEMNRAAEKIISSLNFSGLCGLDFLLDATTGDAYLIEMNARATQTCPLPLAHGQDLVESLCSKFSGTLPSATAIELQTDRIALFPTAWQGDQTDEMFTSAYHDVPWEEPELVRLGMDQIKHGSSEKWIRLFSKLGLYQP
ncbi:MAG: ATP-grasp domain-containing protein [Acidobacteriaceae bacterium]